MPRVTVLPSGLSSEVEADTLHEACADYGLPVPFGCTVGKCGVCRVEVIDGDLAEASRFEEAVLEAFDCPPGVRLACQARLAGDVTVRPMGASRQAQEQA